MIIRGISSYWHSFSSDNAGLPGLEKPKHNGQHSKRKSAQKGSSDNTSIINPVIDCIDWGRTAIFLQFKKDYNLWLDTHLQKLDPVGKEIMKVLLDGKIH